MNTLMRKGLISYDEARSIIRSSLPPEMPGPEKRSVVDFYDLTHPSAAMTMDKPTGELNIEAVLRAMRDQIGKHGSQIGVMNWIVVALVLVLFIGFAGMFSATGAVLWDAWHSKAASYESLRDEVQAQNAKIDTLSKEIHGLNPDSPDESNV